MDDRDVGFLGELDVQRWCVEANLVCNVSRKDKTGWDCIIEAPFNYSSLPSSLDKSPYPLRCFVQVKATDRRDRSESIKLSNWMYMVFHPFPVFILFLEYDGTNILQNAFLVHIDEYQIKKALKKLRSLTEEQRKHPNREELAVSYGSKNRINPANGETFLNALRRAVGPSTSQYTINKYNLVKSVGYENIATTMSFTFNIPAKYTDPREYFVDLLIGAANSIDVIEGSIYDVRFGIQSPDPLVKLDGGKIAFNPHLVGNGSLVLRSPDSIRYTRVNGEVFAPQNLPADFDRGLLKVRFLAPFIDIVMQPYSNKHSVEIKFPEIQTPQRLDHIAQLADMMLFFADHPKENPYDIIVNGQSTLKGTVSILWEPDANVKRIFSLIANTKSISERFGIPTDISVKISNIIQQSDSITLINHLYTNNPYMRVSFSSDEDITANEKLLCAPLTVSCIIGEYAVVVGIALIGRGIQVIDSESKEIEYGIETERPVICKAQRFSSADDILSIIDKFQGEIAETYRDTHDIVMISYK